jgi:hypothetical protein
MARKSAHVKKLYQLRMDAARRLKSAADSRPSKERDSDLAHAAIEYARAVDRHENAEAGRSGKPKRVENIRGGDAEE